MTIDQLANFLLSQLQETTGIHEVDIGDNVFDAGLDSLDAVDFTAHVEDILEFEKPLLSILLDDPTLRSMATLLAPKMNEGQMSIVVKATST